MEVIVCPGIERGQEEGPRARLECQCLDDPCPSGGDGGVLGLGQPQRRREVDRILTGGGGGSRAGTERGHSDPLASYRASALGGRPLPMAAWPETGLGSSS